LGNCTIATATINGCSRRSYVLAKPICNWTNGYDEDEEKNCIARAAALCATTRQLEGTNQLCCSQQLQREMGREGSEEKRLFLFSPISFFRMRTCGKSKDGSHTRRSFIQQGHMHVYLCTVYPAIYGIVYHCYNAMHMPAYLDDRIKANRQLNLARRTLPCMMRLLATSCGCTQLLGPDCFTKAFTCLRLIGPKKKQCTSSNQIQPAEK
jgi:hypothetical protein